MKKISLRNLQKMIEGKYISRQKHPTLDLWIYNYSQKAQFDSVWNNETLSCRGLIMDDKFNIVARPFKKFFNLEELEGQGQKLPVQDFEIYEKMDGSLGVLYWNGNMPHLATRGSFTSDQAIEGTKILHEQLTLHGDSFLKFFSKKHTYLFEIIYPKNRIVVDYHGIRSIYLLAVVNTITGIEVPYKELLFDENRKVNLVKRYDVLDYREFVKQQRENSEGYVIRFKDNLRVKVKFTEYKRLHKLLTGVNARTIWEALRAGESIESMCYRVPDEFYNWIQKAAQILKSQYRSIETSMLRVYDKVEKKLASDAMMPENDEREMRKLRAIEYQKWPEYRGLLFTVLDGKDYREGIWKMIKPAAEKPFKEDDL